MHGRLALPLWIAHRGAGKLAPENTLAAFRLGAQHGYRAFECDVKLSADGVPFLLHDATLERTTSGQGTGRRPALGRAVAAGRRQLARPRAFAGEPLPTLANLARFMQANGFALNIEIKPTPGHEQATGRAVGAACAALWAGPGAAAASVPSGPRRCRARARPRRICRARCCSTACGRAGKDVARRWAAWPWSPTTS
jgi:glycerophosphoryl diester phosphodiesterase